MAPSCASVALSQVLAAAPDVAPAATFRQSAQETKEYGLTDERRSKRAEEQGAKEDAQITLIELAEGPYFVLAAYLDASSLCGVDTACRLLRALNCGPIGPWRALGARAFHGMELERDGMFEMGDREDQEQRGQDQPPESGRKWVKVDWKGRYRRFRAEILTFRTPFSGTEISSVRFPDEVAYCRCQLRTDLLEQTQDAGVYIEVEVLANPDNLSLAVLDFEEGGRSSVTFSPDTGGVIRERKVREAPRKVEGAYIQPLPTTQPGRRFEGMMGLYLRSGRLAFFRRCRASEELGPWESTGFVTGLSWAEGRRLTPCLAFRDEGSYHVRVVRVGADPPLPLEKSASSCDEAVWSALDWEAGQPAPNEA